MRSNLPWQRFAGKSTDVNKTFMEVGSIFPQIYDRRIALPAVVYQEGLLDSAIKGVTTDEFWLSPPFGRPRDIDYVTLKKLEKSEWIRMCLQFYVDSISNAEWDIVPVDEDKAQDPDVQEHCDEVRSFFEHLPSEESFDIILAKMIPDWQLYDCGSILKVYPKWAYDENGYMLTNQEIEDMLGRGARVPVMDLTVKDGRSLTIEAPPVGGRWRRFWQYCLDEQTRVLTENGFKHYWEYHKGEKIAAINPETHKLEWIKPVKLHVFDVEDEEFHYYKTRFVDFACSSGHKIYYNHGKMGSNNWQLKASDAIEEERIRFLKVVGWDGIDFDEISIPIVPYDKQVSYLDSDERHIPIDIWLEFLGYYLSEGSIRANMDETSHYDVTISQMLGEKANKIRECLLKMPYKVVESSRKSDGYTMFRIFDKSLARFLRLLGNKYQKHIPKEIKNLPLQRLQILLDALILGDGHVRKQYSGSTVIEYFSTSKRLRDDVAEVMMKCGYAVTMRDDEDRRSPSYSTLYVASGNRTIKETEVRRSKHVTKNVYTGVMWCFELPIYHIFITERNGKMGIHGNSWMSPTSIPTPFDVREVIYFQSYPTGRGVYGTSNLETIQNIVNYLLDTVQASSKFYENGMFIGGQIDHPDIQDPDELKRRAAVYRQQLRGPDKYGKWLTTGGNVKVTPLQFTAQQMQQIDHQHWYAKVVMGLFKVQPSEIGFTEDLNRATAISQVNLQKSRALWPAMTKIERMLNRYLIWSDFYTDVKFQFVRARDLEDEMKQLSVWQGQYQLNLASVNQLMREIGKDPWPHPAFDAPMAIENQMLQAEAMAMQPDVGGALDEQGYRSDEQKPTEKMQKAVNVSSQSGEAGYAFAPKVYDGQRYLRQLTPIILRTQAQLKADLEETRKKILRELEATYEKT